MSIWAKFKKVYDSGSGIPSMRFKLKECSLKLKPNRGCEVIYASSYGHGRGVPATFYGTIFDSGYFKATDECPEDAKKMIQLLEENFDGVVAAYGKKIGACCLCAKTLTDERSIFAGYGPTCAKKYNLYYPRWEEINVAETA